jgi:hypothetical protein
MKTEGTGIPVWAFARRFLEYRYLPAILAAGAILVMLPALKTGLFADDLVQRAVELKPGQLPARLLVTGIPPDTGNLATVLHDLFPGITRMPQAKSYGVLPWWAPDDLKLGLWRPLTALTHWLDYHLFPDTPALMHAQNIAWFAATVLLVNVIYRKLMGSGWAAGLAALLFLLDGFLYFPVMFVANRGFIISLCLGLFCFYEHHRWRSTKSRSGCLWSALFLALSLFANEGGVSTLAFILAYALVLEPGSFRNRALTVLPSILVIVLWQAVYKLGGFGVFHVGLYIDPANEPLAFAPVMIPRTVALLGGQLTGVAPELLLAIKPSLQPIVTVLYGLAVIVALAVFLPWVRRDKIAAFWLTAMVLAVVPAATVAPISKNLGFVAVGAYGLIASFTAALFTRPPEWPGPSAYRNVARITCALLLLIHVPGVIVGRVLVMEATAPVLHLVRSFVNTDKSSSMADKDVIIINAPCSFTLAYTPFYKAYQHEPLPRTLRALVPGGTGFDVQRIDDRTLVIQSRASDIFSCDDVGSVDIAYALSACNVAIGVPRSKKGDRHDLGELTVEVLDSNAADVATRVAFRFNTPLDSPDFHWLWWDWQHFAYEPFKVPAIGQRVTLPGPAR